MLDGKTVAFDGRHFRARGARLYDLPERRVPVYMSAFGPEAAAIAGRLADGLPDRKYKMMAMLGPDPARHVRQHLRHCARTG